MQKNINYDDNYSTEYRTLLSSAITEAKRLGFTRDFLISEDIRVSDEELRKASKVVTEVSHHLDFMIPGYWGNCCQALSTQIFAHLNALGISANIVIGNVIINGTDEFDATLDNIRDEYLSAEPLTGCQSIHAWVSLGDDTVIDAAIPPRLVKYYGAPEEFNDMILIHRASALSSRYKLRYQPLIVGTEFFAKTNPPDPMEILALIRGI